MGQISACSFYKSLIVNYSLSLDLTYDVIYSFAFYMSISYFTLYFFRLLTLIYFHLLRFGSGAALT